METKKRFLFYLDWRKQMNIMTDKQLRRFINNLCDYTEGKDVDLPTKIEMAVWNGVVPSLKINQENYERKVKINQINGRLGGRPRKEEYQDNPNGFSNNPENLINDNSKEISVKRKMENDNREEITEKSKMESDIWKRSIENREIVNDNVKIDDVFSDAEQVLSSNPKENQVDKLKQYGGITFAEYYRNKNQKYR
jgi:hypothetical protein